MPIHKLDHYNIETVIPEETVRFYRDVLGCADGSHLRPEFSRPGTWLLVGGHPAIHINFEDVDKAAPTGALDHVAFEGEDYLALRRRFDACGVTYQAVESPHIDLFQIFLTDPNQIKVEINIRGEAESVAAYRKSMSEQ